MTDAMPEPQKHSEDFPPKAANAINLRNKKIGRLKKELEAKAAEIERLCARVDELEKAQELN